jgi:hypothetical protein
VGGSFCTEDLERAVSVAERGGDSGREIYREEKLLTDGSNRKEVRCLL